MSAEEAKAPVGGDGVLEGVGMPDAADEMQGKVDSSRRGEVPLA